MDRVQVKYELRDWDGSVIKESATLNEMAEYFGFDPDTIKDELDIEDAIRAAYDGMKAPTFKEIKED